MKKLMLLLLLPINAYGASLEELSAMLNGGNPSAYQGHPIYQGQPMVSPETDRVLRDSYIRSGSIFGETSPRPLTGTPQYNDWLVDQAMRGMNMRWSDYEAKKSQRFNPFKK